MRKCKRGGMGNFPTQNHLEALVRITGAFLFYDHTKHYLPTLTRLNVHTDQSSRCKRPHFKNKRLLDQVNSD